MKKKVLLSILICTVLLIVVGCSNSESNKKEEKVDETLFTINNLEFHLDKDSEFKNIKYIISKDFKEVIHDRYIQYNYYQDDSTNLLFYRIFYYQNKDTKYAINDLGLDKNIKMLDGKTDNINYKYYFTPRYDGGTIHFYFINKGKDLYVLNFVSKYDIKDFEEKVLNSINFNENK